ncbi:MAG: undecaprenyldiphospho-muramoylpentapeptide beta-N-acetylglucosaminyltransferase [Rhodospirillales bacterium]|nr:undecaprenyldiphospho-muramoylpentapeptide beta-N-acetylglucosaminyltransferase [Rhodospirillales bacterium]MCB9965495.1 undecaprenyldiphospho-muramoylpentapeptide beta-N-acetylglucosaminyltransferase [Rhodospirillales bacterium]MCB9973643.1 undecaprenyldiphospho-muramoylpentapeptide beta-N-acetylglucosaminyltransferase [Rhodospirillales bacterium]MCB9980443.1 undecaprenyldiphospho-muramoylpentapeptide beta-N-acetylglucosaminyltransferase [Rhodospirillales bacterium]
MTDQPSSSLILLSAGGTGGHIMPAIALAQDLVSRGYQVEIVTDPRCRHYKDLYPEIPFHVLSAGTLGKGLWGKFTGLCRLGWGLLQARSLVRHLKPRVVVGFGGYPSYPAVYAAQKRKIPTIIHEANAILGKANRMLAPGAERIALSWPVTDQTGISEVDSMRVVQTGNPVRSEIAGLFTRPYPALSYDSPMTILVMGGSLGAKIFSTVIPKALAMLPAEQRARLHVIQQCHESDIHTVRQDYHDAGIKARLEVFFKDVPELLAECHLFIGRSGASTVTEMTAAGRPAIFVPYPHHADQQQLRNAEAIANEGGAWVIPEKAFTAEALLPRIETFLQHPEILFEAAEASRACGKPDAARKLGNLVMALASGWGA